MVSTELTWNLTVWSLIPSVRAIALFGNPAATRPSTSRSRRTEHGRRSFGVALAPAARSTCTTSGSTTWRPWCTACSAATTVSASASGAITPPACRPWRAWSGIPAEPSHSSGTPSSRLSAVRLD